MPVRCLVNLVVSLIVALGCGGGWAANPPQILVNHLGYDVVGPKRVVVQTAEDIAIPQFQVLDRQGRVAFEGPLTKVGKVDGWQGRYFHEADFSALVQPGSYHIQVKGVRSESFVLRDRLLPGSCLADLVYYFRTQRCTGIYDKVDRNVSFFGEPQRKPVDVHGGWYDASGDVSKYLGYLTESNYVTPQGTPIVVWCFLQARELLQGVKDRRLRSVIPLLEEEAIYGADFLVRMQDPSGYFYTSVCDGCSNDPTKREICGYEGLDHAKHNRTKSAMRDGGGLAIAALARASMLHKKGGDYSPQRYLAAAETGFEHLLTHNLEYAFDHRENMLDDYCGLLAATELYNASKKEAYLQAARARAESLMKRLAKDEKYSGWWRADEDGTRPFFHLSDAGLPVLALVRYLQCESDATRKTAAEKAVLESLRFELAITREVANPFGYARQYVKDAGGGKRGSFFFPHRNETGYWWAGENSRLASLAAAARLGSQFAPPEMAAELKTYAGDQVNWIFGLNPYDMCMLHGKGWNNPMDYEAGAPNPTGSICNGITAGVEDERDIAFLPAPYGNRGEWSWRWCEQWIPHSAYMILALAAQAKQP